MVENISTLTLYPVADAELEHYGANATFASHIGAAEATGYTPGATVLYLGLLQAGTTSGRFNILIRDPFVFDTTGLPAGATITGATLYLYPVDAADSFGGFAIGLVPGSLVTPPTFEAEDWSGSTATELASRVTYAALQSGDHFPFALNAAGLAHINPAGYTTFFVRAGWDISGSFTGTWTSGGLAHIAVTASEGTALQRPYLEIEYTVSAPTVDLAGTLSIASSAHAEAVRTLGLTGTASATTGTTGDLYDPLSLEGTISAAATLASTLRNTTWLSGACVAASGAAGDIYDPLSLIGTAAGETALEAELARIRGITGTITGACDAYGAFYDATHLAGGTTIAATLTGAIVENVRLDGGIYSTTSCVGTVNKDMYLQGTVAAVSFARGTEPSHILDVTPIHDSFVVHEQNGLTFAQIRAASGTSVTRNDQCTLTAALGTYDSPTDTFYDMYRGIFSFDTSAIPNIATIRSATLTFYCCDKLDSVGTFEVCVTGCTTTTPTEHAYTDYAAFLDTELATRVAIATITTNSTFQFALNEEGLAYLNKTGYTTFMIRTGWDVDNSYTGVWASSGFSRLSVSSENAAANKPVLSVEYTTGIGLELDGDITALSGGEGTVNTSSVVARIYRKFYYGGTYELIDTVPWDNGTIIDYGPFVVDAIYFYLVEREDGFGNVLSSASAPIQIDDYGDIGFAGVCRTSAACSATLSSTQTTNVAVIHRAVDDGAMTVYDVVAWNGYTYTDYGPFENSRKYSYTVTQDANGTIGNTSNLVSIYYNGPGTVELEGAVAASTAFSGSLSSDPVCIIERSVGGGAYEVIAHAPNAALQYADWGPFEDGQTYSYRIKKRAQGELGEYSNVATVTWHTPNYVLLEGEIVDASLFESALSFILKPSGTTGADTTLSGTLAFRRTLAASTITAVSSAAASLSASEPFAGSLAATTDATGSVTEYVRLDGEIGASSGTSGAVTEYVRLDGKIGASSGTSGAVGKKVAISGTVPATTTVSPVLVYFKRVLTGSSVCKATLTIPHMGVSANREVIGYVDTIVGNTASSHIQLQSVSGYVAPIVSGHDQSHIVVTSCRSHVEIIEAVAEGYIIAKNLLEIMVGEGPYITVVVEEPFDIEYAESEYEEEQIA